MMLQMVKFNWIKFIHFIPLAAKSIYMYMHTTDYLYKSSFYSEQEQGQSSIFQYFTFSFLKSQLAINLAINRFKANVHVYAYYAS